MYTVNLSRMAKGWQCLDVEIPNGGTASDAILVTGGHLAAALIVSAWTAGALGFSMCDTAGGTYNPVQDAAAAAIGVATPAANVWYDLADKLQSMRYFKVTAGAAQGAARTIKLIFRAD